jgi:low temperature requirement protein LtrA
MAEHAARRVHWLELFFDLVMVAYIGQIAHSMHGDPSWLDGAVFFAFLAAAWWAWVNATITMNLFGANVTPSIWIAVTIGMIAIGVMAAAVPDALTERAAAFAIANSVIRLIWAWPWVTKRAITGVPWWRPVLYCFVPAALWIVSVWIPAPWQYVVWATAVAVEIVMLSFLGGQRAWLRSALDVDHLIERVGLLVVIVFGESVLSIIAEFDLHWSLVAGVTAVLGLAAVSMLAWIFFGYATAAVERGVRRLQLRGSVGGLRDAVMYLPYLLIAGIALFAAGLGTAVADAGHLLPIGAAVCLGTGISLFFVASVAESLRYGAPWSDVALWGPAGIVLPWLLAPLSTAVEAEWVVAACVVLLGLLVALNEINARRVRRRWAQEA